MKNILLYAGLLFISLSTGCNKKETDAACYWVFNVNNGTVSEMVIETSEGGYNRKSFTIPSGGTQEVYHIFTHCGSGDTMGDMFAADEVMANVQTKINGEPAPEYMWVRKYWTFSNAANGDGIYTLIANDEFFAKGEAAGGR